MERMKAEIQAQKERFAKEKADVSTNSACKINRLTQLCYFL